MGLVALNTTVAAAAGSMAAMFFVYFRSGKWDLPAILNGCLAGLVGITAGCAYVAPGSSAVIGVIAGILVILSGDLFERLKIDDAAGAFHVHGTCGAFACIAVGLFGLPALTGNEPGLLVGGGISTLITQITGVAVIVIYVAITGVIMWTILKVLGILRISDSGEAMGIDAYEHGQTAYPDIIPMPTESAMSPEAGRSVRAAGD
jgi:Amt family ammonium transporter